jgi:hypothetical protein
VAGKIKKPIMPTSPKAPEPPVQFLYEKEYVLSFHDFEVPKGLDEIIKCVPEGISLSEIYFFIEYDYDNYYYGGFYYMKKIKNPKFEKQLIEFENKMKKYNVQMEKFFIEKEKYNEQKKLYDSQESLRILEEKKNQKRKLEKKLAQLKKDIGE